MRVQNSNLQYFREPSDLRDAFNTSCKNASTIHPGLEMARRLDEHSAWSYSNTNKPVTVFVRANSVTVPIVVSANW